MSSVRLGTHERKRRRTTVSPDWFFLAGCQAGPHAPWAIGCHADRTASRQRSGEPLATCGSAPGRCGRAVRGRTRTDGKPQPGNRCQCDEFTSCRNAGRGDDRAGQGAGRRRTTEGYPTPKIPTTPNAEPMVTPIGPRNPGRAADSLGGTSPLRQSGSIRPGKSRNSARMSWAKNLN